MRFYTGFFILSKTRGWNNIIGITFYEFFMMSQVVKNLNLLVLKLVYLFKNAKKCTQQSTMSHNVVFNMEHCPSFKFS